MGIGLILNDLIKKNKTSVSALSKKTNISSSTIYSIIKRDNKKVSIDVLSKLADELGVNLDYFYNEEKEDVKNYTLPNNAIPVGPIGKLPILGNVSAGNGTLAYDNIIGYETVDEKYANENYFYLKVVGDSMSPKIEDGDLVLVHKQPSVNSGNYAVVIVDDEDGRVKIVKYGVDWIELHSINPYYPTRDFKGKDIERIRIIGKVIEIKRKL